VKSDFLKYESEKFDYVAGNIPYQISSPVIEKLRTMNFGKAVIMVQDEFAKRLCAKQGSQDYSRLSVMTSLYFNCKIDRKVSRKNFHPIPKVDSAIVTMEPIPWDYGIKFELVEELAKKLFSQRRKKISTVLKNNELEYGNKRVEELTPNEFIRLCYSLYPDYRHPC